MRENEGLGEIPNRKQAGAIAALLTSRSVAEAATQAKVSEATLWRWMREEEFTNEYRRARRMAVSQAVARIQSAASLAVDTLCSVMSDSSLPASSRVAAARTVLETGVKAAELEDLAERLAHLEALAIRAEGGRIG